MLNGAQIPFAPDGGLPLACMRAAWVAALMLVFGSVLFCVVIAPRALRRIPPGRDAATASALARLVQLALAASVLAGFGWLLLETGDLAATSGLPATVAAIPTVLTATRFGRLLGLQLGLLVCTSLCFGTGAGLDRARLALLPGTLALLSQAGHGHAASMESAPFLLLASVVHLLGAGAWLGGLPPLLLMVRMAPVKAAATAAWSFSPLGKLCIAALAGSAVVQVWVLLGSVAALFGTSYGWMVLVKLSLFGVLLGFAAMNRYRLAPALLRADPVSAKRSLSASIALQSGASLAILLAAAVLASLPPGMDVEPVWPFTWQFSLETLREQPELRAGVAWALLGLLASVLLAIGALLLHRRPPVALAAIAVASGLAWLSVPRLGPLVAGAVPTSFQTSPAGFTADSIVQGAALYPARCATCHGPYGRRGGDLASSRLWTHSDGRLFWWLSHGIGAPRGGLPMPGFASSLSETDRWDLIEAIRARNAGLAGSSTGVRSRALQAPGLQASCAGGKSVTLDDLRAHVVLVRIDRGTLTRFRTTITTPLDPSLGACISDDQAVPLAYAIVSGQTIEAMAGMRFLVDARGWLRAFEPAGISEARLQAAIAHVASHPLAVHAPAHHLHRET